MGVANDSILVTPGTGATVATHLVNAKEHQSVVISDPAGQMWGDFPSWVASTGATAHVAAARTILAHIFNAVASGVIIKVRGIYIIPALAVVTGVGMTYEIIRTSVVGTVGTAIVPGKFDTADAALPAGVTTITKPTVGATTDAVNVLTLFVNGTSEETIPYASQASSLNHIPLAGTQYFRPIILREGQGLKVDQTTNSSVGNVNIVIAFTVE